MEKRTGGRGWCPGPTQVLNEADQIFVVGRLKTDSMDSLGGVPGVRPGLPK